MIAMVLCRDRSYCKLIRGARLGSTAHHRFLCTMRDSPYLSSQVRASVFCFDWMTPRSRHFHACSWRIRNSLRHRMLLERRFHNSFFNRNHRPGSAVRGEDFAGHTANLIVGHSVTGADEVGRLQFPLFASAE